MFLSLAVLSVAMQSAPEPMVEILEPGVSARFVTLDPHGIPIHHYDLLEDAGKLDSIDRQAYFARLDEYIDDAYHCDRPMKLAWMVQLIHRTREINAIQARVRPLLDRLILEKPRCFLEAFRRIETGIPPNILMHQLIFTEANELLEEQRSTLAEPLAEPGFSDVADVYRVAEKHHNDQLERERMRERRRKALAEKEFREKLLDENFLASDNDAYWQRWEAVTRKARKETGNCESPEALQTIFTAALMHIDNPATRNTNAEFVESLVFEQPICVLVALDGMRRRTAFIETYLFEPVFHTATEIYGPLAWSAPTEDAKSMQQSYRKQFARRQQESLAPMPPAEKLIWSAQLLYTDNDGRLYVSPVSQGPLKPYLDRVGELWEQTPGSERRGEYDREFKPLPLEELEFITNGRSGHYQLLDIRTDGVDVVHAEIIGAALAEWYCGGPIPLFELEVEERPEWLPRRQSFFDVIAIETGRETPLIQATDVETDEHLFTTGRLTWPGTGRSADFRFTSAYVGVDFDMTDNQTSEKHYGQRPAWDCH